MDLKPGRGKLLVLEMPSPEGKSPEETDDCEQIHTGKVVEVGDRKITENGMVIPMQAGIGDVVLFPHYVGISIKENEDTYFVLYDEDITAYKRS